MKKDVTEAPQEGYVIRKFEGNSNRVESSVQIRAAVVIPGSGHLANSVNALFREDAGVFADRVAEHEEGPDCAVLYFADAARARIVIDLITTEGTTPGIRYY